MSVKEYNSSSLSCAFNGIEKQSEPQALCNQRKNVVTKSIRLVAADDHQIFLDGLTVLFTKLDWVQFLGSASDGDGLLALTEQHQPDIALIDLSMSGASVEKIVTATQKNYPHTKLVALTMSKDTTLAQKLFTLGLAGYVLKDTAFEDLLTALQEVANGEQFMSPSLADEMYDSDLCEIYLTEREQEVLHCVSRGMLNKQIAHMLRISERTVCFHLSNCFTKLDVSNRSEAIAVALSGHLIHLA